MIEAITRRVEKIGLKNVTTVLGTPTDARLPKPVDAVLIVDAYHEMEQPIVLLRNVAKSLKPNGRIGIVDFKKDGGGPGPAMEERVDPEVVIGDAEPRASCCDRARRFSDTSTCWCSNNRGDERGPAVFRRIPGARERGARRLVPAMAARCRGRWPTRCSRRPSACVRC